MSNQSWNRRDFIAAAGLAGLVSATRLPAATSAPLAKSEAPASFIAHVGFAAKGDLASDRIETFLVRDGAWTRMDEPVKARQPKALALHPTLPVLYVAHSTGQHRNLPRGSVSAYRVEPSTGALTLLNREPLSLSAIRPEHLSVSPDGTSVFVSATGGGSYNLFSLAKDGALIAVPYALKQTGSGPHPLQPAARPRASVFHPSGSSIYASDLGADRLSHFANASGALTPASRVSFSPGSGPAHLAMHPSGNFLIVGNQLRPELSVIPLDAATGQLLTPVQQLPVDAATAGPLAINSQGNRLYLASNQESGKLQISTFGFSTATGRLRQIASLPVRSFGKVEQLRLVDRQLLLVGDGGIASITVEPRSGLLGTQTLVTAQPNAVSLAISLL
jgi:6-phosphogluconolactonase